MTERSRTLNLGAWWGAMGLVWLLAWSHLCTEWRINDQYQYGWSIPFLFAYMAGKRWAGPFNALRHRWAPLLLLLPALGTLAIGELLRWQDPLWRMTGAQLTLAASLISCAWFLRIGGWPLLRRMLFPLVFAWSAVPWPIPLENWLTQYLLRFITTLTVLLTNTLGIAALQHGNTIELSNGVFGIDEACSGIRSLQAAVMAALFLGEFFSLNTPRRCLLFLGGWITCILTNALRVQCMALLVAAKGSTAAFGWHDCVGTTASALSFLLIGLSAYWLSRKGAPEPEPHAKPVLTPGWDGFLTLGCVAIIPLGAWLLFGRVSATLPQTPQWQLAFDHLPPGWSAEPIEPSKTVKDNLRFSEWKGCSVRSPRGCTAQVIHLFWKPDTRMPGMAFFHTPALCMGSAGWASATQPELWTLALHQRPLPCVAYRMEKENSRELVLQSLLLGSKATHFIADPTQEEGAFDRLATRWRAPWQQVTEEILVYMPDLGRADSQHDAAEELLRLLFPHEPQS